MLQVDGWETDQWSEGSFKQMDVDAIYRSSAVERDVGLCKWVRMHGKLVQGLKVDAQLEVTS